jgi:hypothetical protein
VLLRSFVDTTHAASTVLLTYRRRGADEHHKERFFDQARTHGQVMMRTIKVLHSQNSRIFFQSSCMHYHYMSTTRSSSLIRHAHMGAVMMR